MSGFKTDQKGQTGAGLYWSILAVDDGSEDNDRETSSTLAKSLKKFFDRGLTLLGIIRKLPFDLLIFRPYFCNVFVTGIGHFRIKEIGAKVDHDKAIILRDPPDLVVTQVPRNVRQCPAGRMGGEDRSRKSRVLDRPDDRSRLG